MIKLTDLQGAENLPKQQRMNTDDDFISGFNFFFQKMEECGVGVDVERLTEIIQDINFEAYGFSHEEVADKLSKTLASTANEWLKLECAKGGDRG